MLSPILCNKFPYCIEKLKISTIVDMYTYKLSAYIYIYIYIYIYKYT